MSNALTQLTKARRALAEAKTLDEVLDIRDKAEAIRHYAKVAGESLEAMNEAAEVKLRAERKAGEFLHENIRDPGRPRSNGSTAEPLSLSEIGLNKKQSHLWQRIASIPEDTFTDFIAKLNEAGKEITSREAYKLAQRLAVEPEEEREPQEFGTRTAGSIESLDGLKFGTIYADPPWRYGNQATRASTDNHYDTMSVDELCEMPIADLAADDAHLHLWTTNAFLFDARRVIEAWGFEYRSCFVWVKPQMGIGNYWRVSHEFMLLGIKGDAKRFYRKDAMSWGQFERGKHSRKPEEIRKLIEECSPGPYLELFGRRRVIGWTVLGNQIGKELELER